MRLTPREIVQNSINISLGQYSQTRGRGIALRNLAPCTTGRRSCGDEVAPKIHYDWSHGRGQTEIARRLAIPLRAPLSHV